MSLLLIKKNNKKIEYIPEVGDIIMYTNTEVHPDEAKDWCTESKLKLGNTFIVVDVWTSTMDIVNVKPMHWIQVKGKSAYFHRSRFTLINRHNKNPF